MDPATSDVQGLNSEVKLGGLDSLQQKAVNPLYGTHHDIKIGVPQRHFYIV